MHTVTSNVHHVRLPIMVLAIPVTIVFFLSLVALLSIILRDEQIHLPRKAADEMHQTTPKKRKAQPADGMHQTTPKKRKAPPETTTPTTPTPMTPRISPLDQCSPPKRPQPPLDQCSPPKRPQLNFDRRSPTPSFGARNDGVGERRSKFSCGRFGGEH